MSQFVAGNPGGSGGAWTAAQRVFGGVAEDEWDAIVAKAIEPRPLLPA